MAKSIALAKRSHKRSHKCSNKRGRPKAGRREWPVEGVLVEPTTDELRAQAEAGWRALQLLMWEDMERIFGGHVRAAWREQGVGAMALFGRPVVVVNDTPSPTPSPSPVGEAPTGEGGRVVEVPVS